jgi:hypothetical protein
MEKRQLHLFLPLVMPYVFALIRVQVTPAATHGRSVSDRVSEERHITVTSIFSVRPAAAFSPAT